MSRIHYISWNDVLDLRVVRALGRLINQRWNLGLGFVTASGMLIEGHDAEHYSTAREVCTWLRAHSHGDSCAKVGDAIVRQLKREWKRSENPSPSIIYTCFAGLREVAAPILTHGELHGAVFAGGYYDSDLGNLRARLSSIGVSSQAVLDHATVQMPRLEPLEEDYLRQLVELLAKEIGSFQEENQSSERRRHASPGQRRSRYSFDEIIGQSPPMKDLYRLMDKVIDSDSTVLIQGENGTGKELIARAIHFNSGRKDRRFVVQNCSAFNDNLLDSELFGHKKGSFTGAVSDKRGLFEVADGSTFFLDEIGDMSPTLQVKLLRVLQEGTFIPVGDTRSKTVDVRIIAATNRNLKKMVEAGQFREDLYYRINVININIPPLRDRREDIGSLVDHFLKQHAKGDRRHIKKLSKGCVERLYAYNWPGNIRELENEIERLVVLARDDKIIGQERMSSRIARRPMTGAEMSHQHNPHCLPEAVQVLERTMIFEVLKRNHWNKTRAAKELHISRRNLIRKVAKYDLDQR